MRNVGSVRRNAAARRAFAAVAIPVPEGVTSAVIRLADSRRYAVPAVLICQEFTPAQISELISPGELPELDPRCD